MRITKATLQNTSPSRIGIELAFGQIHTFFGSVPILLGIMQDKDIVALYGIACLVLGYLIWSRYDFFLSVGDWFDEQQQRMQRVRT